MDIKITTTEIKTTDYKAKYLKQILIMLKNERGI